MEREAGDLQPIEILKMVLAEHIQEDHFPKVGNAVEKLTEWVNATKAKDQPSKKRRKVEAAPTLDIGSPSAGAMQALLGVNP